MDSEFPFRKPSSVVAQHEAVRLQQVTTTTNSGIKLKFKVSAQPDHTNDTITDTETSEDAHSSEDNDEMGIVTRAMAAAKPELAFSKDSSAAPTTFAEVIAAAEAASAKEEANSAVAADQKPSTIGKTVPVRIAKRKPKKQSGAKRGKKVAAKEPAAAPPQPPLPPPRPSPPRRELSEMTEAERKANYESWRPSIPWEECRARRAVALREEEEAEVRNAKLREEAAAASLAKRVAAAGGSGGVVKTAKELGHYPF